MEHLNQLQLLQHINYQRVFYLHLGFQSEYTDVQILLTHCW